ncbi:hypothetical protein PoB_000218900 [Plakobranchus ocellatus]|uniref:Uncharacterized protein n=1 Tax=Plakobranchus ocellatus TaxID=259542 RepID=A0AAV3Y118_9GAST|nr:hypothetical protein PoB_000218900 [Plakobranchus ocellatus]
MLEPMLGAKSRDVPQANLRPKNGESKAHVLENDKSGSNPALKPSEVSRHFVDKQKQQASRAHRYQGDWSLKQSALFLCFNERRVLRHKIGRTHTFPSLEMRNLRCYGRISCSWLQLAVSISVLPGLFDPQIRGRMDARAFVLTSL